MAAALMVADLAVGSAVAKIAGETAVEATGVETA